MQKAAKTDRFLTDFSSIAGIADLKSTASPVGSLRQVFVSQLAHTASSHQLYGELSNKLIRLAEHAYSLRDLNALREPSRVLMNLPIRDARQIGLFYQALTFKRKGQIDKAQSLLQAVADNAPLAFRARAVQSLGALYHEKGQVDEALRFYLETTRAASSKGGRNPLAVLMAQIGICLIESAAGDHRAAVSDLEKLSPLVRLAAAQNPLYFYFYKNALAVELGEVGRIAEAEAACAVALASPFAVAYPEWAETRDELAARRNSATPSVVAISRAPQAEPSRKTKIERASKPLGVTPFGWVAQGRTYFQTSIIALAARAAITEEEIIPSLLDRARNCFRPRSPPASS